MNIFGIGAAELILILILMLSVAGPKRMIQWAYVLGKYTAQIRRMVEESWAQVRKEFEAVNVELPKDIPTRTNLSQEVNKFLNTEFTKLEQEEQRAKQAESGTSTTPSTPMGSKYGGSASNPAATTSAAPASNGATPESQDNPKSGYDAWLPK